MSFDSEFDYSAAETAMDAKITEQTAIIAALDAQIASVNALPAAYDTEKIAKVATLTQKKDIEQQSKDNAQSVKDEITAINALGAGNKTSLYDFYAMVGESKRNYMQRMLYNHATGLVTDAAAVLADANLDTQDKQQMAAELVCGKYQIHRNSYLVFRLLQ